MILILAQDDDRTADQVETLLRARGARFLRFSNSCFPADARVSIEYADGGKCSGVLRLGDAEFPLAGFTAAWMRASHAPRPHPAIPEGLARKFAAHECERFIEDVWETLKCRWLPAPIAAIRRIGMLTQARAARELGFDLPPTLITNDPREFLEFSLEHNGRIVEKAAHPYASSVRDCPSMFQACLPKRSDLRVTVVGRRVFGYPLPEDVERRCVALLERLGLNFGVIDLILTMGGQYMFVEATPAGEWDGMAIAEAICDFLTAAVAAV